MNALDLKIPPPIIALLIAGAMWWISRIAPLMQLTDNARYSAAILFAVVGIGFIVSGNRMFRRVGTTVNPMKPETASTLVTSGIFQITRNPMYVGLSIILLALAIFLSSGWALLGPTVNVLYLNRFQVIPEERALLAIFGADYTRYKTGVRRWL